MITLKMTKNQINSLKRDYQDARFRYDIPYTEFQVKTSDCVITAYTSGKVVFAGQNASKHAQKYNDDIQAQTKPNVKFPMAGSDEVGTGDFFGPVTVCACYLNKDNLSKIPVDEIIDSKQINDDKIRQLAPILMEELDYSLLILNNAKYNEVHKKYNLNQIKAILHNQAFLHLDKKVKLPKDNTIIDQFMPKQSYFKALNDQKETYKELIFVTKAENQYLAVACAAIIARYAFLESLDALELKFDCKLPKGAGTHVDAAGKDFVQKHGLDALDKVAKTHFKNKDKIIQLLQD